MALKRSIIFIIIYTVLCSQSALAQNPLMNKIPRGGGGKARSSGSDSIQFEKRNFADDSVTIRFRYLDTARFRSMDSSIVDYFDKVPLDQIT
jgi:hypothetical protein